MLGVARPGDAVSLPAESPKAKVAQRLGFAEVEIEYSRPRVDGREIWGALVPFGEVWRTGADYPTSFSTTEPLRVEGAALAAGRYALYTIPGVDRWTVILSRNTELWGAFGYTPDADELRVEVRPRAAPAHTESFTIEFAEPTYRSAVLVLRWAGLEVPIRLEAEILERVLAEVAAAAPEDWGATWRGARILADLGQRQDLAREWIERSLAVERNWMNLWTAAELAAGRGDAAAAVELGAEALAACRAHRPYCAYSETYRARLAEWSDEGGARPASASPPAGEGPGAERP